MRNYLIPLFIFLALAFSSIAIAQGQTLPFGDDHDLPEGCTSILVGRLASDDGSTITSHTCDGGYRPWVNIKPAATYRDGATNTIYRGLMHTAFAEDMTRVTVKGEVPQVSETYAFVNVAYPCMNEHQLGIGETTIGGRRELRSREGIFQIEELERLALERTTTCRDAIKLMGDLAEKYGYCDGGECLTLIDPKEAWHFEIMGPGPGKIGAVWAAARIPDNHIGVSANIPRIAELDLDDPDYFMASENIHSLAEEMGWWDPDSGETFKFWKAYSGRKPFSIREFWILSTMAPSLNLQYDADELPFTVKPEKKISVRDVMEYLRCTYADSEYDLAQNLPKDSRSDVAHNPWMSSDMKNLANGIQSGIIPRFRAIASTGCAYSTVIQARDWLPDPVGGITWLAFDNPGLTPRVPIYAGVKELPASFLIGDKNKFRRDSAGWAFRRVNKLSNINWSRSGKMITEAVKRYEGKAFAEKAAIEKQAIVFYQQDPQKAEEFLTQYTNDFARSLVQYWWELGDRILER